MTIATRLSLVRLTTLGSLILMRPPEVLDGSAQRETGGCQETSGPSKRFDRRVRANYSCKPRLGNIETPDVAPRYQAVSRRLQIEDQVIIGPFRQPSKAGKDPITAASCSAQEWEQRRWKSPDE